MNILGEVTSGAVSAAYLPKWRLMAQAGQIIRNRSRKLASSGSLPCASSPRALETFESRIGELEAMVHQKLSAAFRESLLANSNEFMKLQTHLWITYKAVWNIARNLEQITGFEPI